MATRFVKASYQEIIDLHTESNHVTAIGIHTPTGNTPRKMFKGYFEQYKKFKYAGAKITFAPVAKLPADPLSVSYEAGEPTIDPRDLANPILVHGCHGNDMSMILNKLYGDNNSISDGMDGLDFEQNLPGTLKNPMYEAMERLYYKALTDRTWKKAGIQRGFTKGGLRPLIYTLATNHQITPSAQFPNGAILNEIGAPFIPGGVPTSEYGNATEAEVGYEIANDINESAVKFFTPHLTRLGWLDTRNVITNSGLGATDEQSIATPNALNELVQSGLISQVNYTELPKLYMLCILLPPAYKTEMYFRAIITHYFQFKDFRGISFMPEQTGVPSYFNANEDLFDADKFDDVDIPNDEGSGTDPDEPDGPDGPLGGDDVIYLDSADFVESVNLLDSNSTALSVPAVNIYSKFTFNGVTYTANSGGFAFCRGVNCGNTTRLGFNSPSLNGDNIVFNGTLFQENSGGYFTEIPWNGTIPPAPELDDTTLADAIGTTEVFDVVYNS